MKRFMALLVVLAVLGMCAPSFGYVLVYKAITSGKALNLTSHTIAPGAVKAFLVMDISDQDGDVTDASLVVYDRVPGPKKFEVIDMSSDITLTTDSDLAAVSMGPEAWWSMTTGKLKAVDVGLVGKRAAAVTMSGRMIIDGKFFDLTDIMGSADVSVTLSKSMTKSANKAAVSVTTVATDIADMLTAKGFTEIP